MPLFGSPNFEKMRAKGDIKGLWKLMVDNQGDLRTQAGKALVEIGVPAVIPLLDLVKVHGLNAEERDLAVGVIGAIGTAAVEPLLAVLKGEDENQRFIAAHALGAIGDARAEEPFLDLLKTEKFSFSQVAAVSYLGKFLGARAQGPILDFMNECKIPFSLLAADSVSAALGDIGDEQSIDLLVALTQYRFKNEDIDTPPQTRANAAGALGMVAGRLKDGPERAKAEAALVSLLKAHNRGLCAYGALALGKVAGHNAAEPLLALLGESEPLVRSSAAYGLGGSMDPGKVEPLIGLLQDTDKNMRANAATGLGYGGDPRALEPLLTCLKDPEPAVRSAAVQSLLFFAHEKDILQLVVACLSDATPDVRSKAAFVLSVFGAEAVAPLIDSLKDGDAAVRMQAAMSLGMLKDARAVEPLISALEEDEDWTVRSWALYALGQIATPQAVEGLKVSPDDRNEFVRLTAVKALKEINASSAGPDRGAMKECLSCHKEVENLRHTCPYCGGTEFRTTGSGQEAASMLDAMQKQAETSQHVDRGARFILEKRYAEAEKELKVAIQINPLNATAHGNMGGVFLMQERFQEAIPWLEKALELNPNLEGVPQALAQARKIAGKT